MEFLLYWFLGSIIAGFIYAIFRLILNKLDEKNWGPWSDVQHITYPKKWDPIDGDWLPPWTYYYQVRFHKITNKIQERRVD